MYRNARKCTYNKMYKMLTYMLSYIYPYGLLYIYHLKKKSQVLIKEKVGNPTKCYRILQILLNFLTYFIFTRISFKIH